MGRGTKEKKKLHNRLNNLKNRKPWFGRVSRKGGGLPEVQLKQCAWGKRIRKDERRSRDHSHSLISSLGKNKHVGGNRSRREIKGSQMTRKNSK